MNTLSLADTLAMTGGTVDAENCPKVIPPQQYLELLHTMERLGARYDEVMKKVGKQWPCFLALIHSPGFSCKVRRVKEGYAILVPLGVPARVRVLSKLLIQYWNRERRVHIIRSPLDEVTWDAAAIPPMLKPIFSEDFDDEEFWQQLEALDESIDIQSIQENDAYELAHLAMVYLISHEFTHIYHDHFDLLENPKQADPDLSETELMRGIETDADDGASALSMLILKEDVDLAAAQGQPVQMELGWLRLTYAVTMIYAISDSHQKYFGAYKGGPYEHPMARCELFFSGVRRAMSTSTAEAKELWTVNSTEGWRRCIWALNDLTMDAMSGKFGQIPEGVPQSPLHTLLYGAANVSLGERVMLDDCKKATELMYKVRKLLPLFNR